jgi:hypothetical protein
VVEAEHHRQALIEELPGFFVPGGYGVIKIAVARKQAYRSLRLAARRLMMMLCRKERRARDGSQRSGHNSLWQHSAGVLLERHAKKTVPNRSQKNRIPFLFAVWYISDHDSKTATR